MSDIVEPLLTVQGLADYLGLKVSTIQRWVRERKVPTVQIGRTIRFERAEVVKHLTVKPKNL